MALTIDNSFIISGYLAESSIMVEHISPRPEKVNAGDLVEGKPVFIVYDERGNEIYKTNFRFSEVPCEDAPCEGRKVPFHVEIPADSRQERYIIKSAEEGEVLTSYSIDGDAPVIHINESPNGLVSGELTVSWNVSDPDSESLYYSVWYSPSNGEPGTWLFLQEFTNENSVSVDSLSLSKSISESKIKIMVSDGVNADSADTPGFLIAGRPPSLYISEPKINQMWKYGSGNYFKAHTLEVEYQKLSADSFVWSSSKDGVFGHGQSLLYSGLSAGTHTITVTINTPGGTASKTVENIVVAEKPPVVSITLGDGTQPGLACNELMLNVVPGDAPLKDLVMQYLPVGSKDWQELKLNGNQLPYKQSANSFSWVNFYANDDATFSDEKEFKIVPNKCYPSTAP